MYSQQPYGQQQQQAQPQQQAWYGATNYGAPAGSQQSSGTVAAAPPYFGAPAYAGPSSTSPSRPMSYGGGSGAPMQQQQQQQQQPYGAPQPAQPTASSIPTDFLADAATKVMLNPNAWESLGGQAWSSGQQYVNKNLKGWINWEDWRRYWNVSNHYVFGKLQLLLFPFRNKNWNRLVVRSEMNGQIEGYKHPRHDINAPDLYIPVMAYITYVLQVGTVMGIEERFRPEVLTMTASTALFFTFVQVVFLKLGMYLLNIGSQEPLVFFTDLIAYSGYQFVTIIFVQSVAIFLRGGLLQFGILAYACLALGWFTLRSLRQIVLPATDPGNAIANPSGTFHRKRRVYFLFIFVVLQVLSVWWLVK